LTLTIHFGWWVIPLAITFASVGLAFWETRNNQGLLGGFALMLCLIPALALSALAWAVAGFFK
jgi:hypothetical protein